jgi:hypothetical protein
MDILFELSRLEDGSGLAWLGYQLVFLKRLLESGYIFFQEVPSGIQIGDIKANPDAIAITLKGRQFIAGWVFTNFETLVTRSMARGRDPAQRRGSLSAARQWRSRRHCGASDHRFLR